MDIKRFPPSVNLVATGHRIAELREARGFSVRDLQDYFGFDAPQAIYKWQKGLSLPTVDNLLALSELLDVPMEQILVRNGSRLTALAGSEPDGSFFLLFFRGLNHQFNDKFPFILYNQAADVPNRESGFLPQILNRQVQFIAYRRRLSYEKNGK